MVTTTSRRSSRKPAAAKSDAAAKPRGPQDPLGKLIARRVAAATTLDGPNEAFMRYLQNPVWNFLCDHYFRLEIDGWHRVPDEPSLLIGIHSGGSLTMDAWTLVHAWHRHFEGKRLLHGTAHDVLMAAPGLGDYFKAVGVLPASRRGVTAALAGDEQPVGAALGHWPNGALDGIVVDLEATIIKITIERAPVIERVANCFCERPLRQVFGGCFGSRVRAGSDGDLGAKRHRRDREPVHELIHWRGGGSGSPPVLLDCGSQAKAG